MLTLTIVYTYMNTKKKKIVPIIWYALVLTFDLLTAADNRHDQRLTHLQWTKATDDRRPMVKTDMHHAQVADSRLKVMFRYRLVLLF